MTAPESPEPQRPRWTTIATRFGAMHIAATAHGICRLGFGDAAGAALRARLGAPVAAADAVVGPLAARAAAAVARPERAHDLPLDPGGTPFQQAVWRALCAVPAGETASYADLAARAGRPGAARAAGAACGANPVAILVPCHRAVRGDGGLGGYAWGLPLKRALLAAEGARVELRLEGFAAEG